MGAEPVLDRREPAGLERRLDARHQLPGDLGWKQVGDPRAENDVRRVCEARDIARELEVGAVRPQPQQQVGKCVEQRAVARLDRRGDPVHPIIVDRYAEEVVDAERYVDVVAPPKKKSLQDVLRERRQAAPLLTARQLREREATRRREEVDREAGRLLTRWRADRTAVDADGKLDPAVYAAVFASSRPAYLESRHWTRRSSAQRKAVPACEVKLCGKSERVHAHHLNHDALGEELAGRDLVTLCERCLRRAVKLEQERRRPATRAELQALDPEEPLYDAAEIAALKAKHSGPLRSSES